MDPIAPKVRQCLARFEVVKIDFDESTSSDGITAGLPLSGLEDQFARFKVWAGNVGAHRTGKSSLEYRLRDASSIWKQVVELLTNLEEALRDASSIIRGDIIPWDREPGSGGSDHDGSVSNIEGEELECDTSTREDQDTEMGQIYSTVVDTVNCLFRLSISIRNPAPHDRFRQMAQLIPTSALAPFDIQHVQEKFPSAAQHTIERLGLANSRRRQYFIYRKSHHQKLADGLEGKPAEDTGKSTIASSIPQHLKTREGIDDIQVLDEDRHSEANMSQTSFASSMNKHKPRVPPLPAIAHEGPFECPFCYMIISATTTRAWKSHVLSDLRPYFCLSADCETPDQDYGRRREWIQHVKERHWRIWSCPYESCDNGEALGSAMALEAHLKTFHGRSSTEQHSNLFQLLPGTPKPLNTPVQCPLCQERLNGLRDYAKHVGRHQVEVSLFALPRLEEDEDYSDAEADQLDNARLHNDRESVLKDAHASESSEEYSSLEGRKIKFVDAELEEAATTETQAPSFGREEKLGLGKDLGMDMIQQESTGGLGHNHRQDQLGQLDWQTMTVDEELAYEELKRIKQTANNRPSSEGKGISKSPLEPLQVPRIDKKPSEVLEWAIDSMAKKLEEYMRKREFEDMRESSDSEEHNRIPKQGSRYSKKRDSTKEPSDGIHVEAHPSLGPPQSIPPADSPNDPNSKVTPIADHMSKAQKEVSFYRCEICKPPRTYARAEHLSRHKAIIHGSLVECQFCGIVMRKDNMIRHLLRKHGSELQSSSKAPSPVSRGTLPPVSTTPGSPKLDMNSSVQPSGTVKDDHLLQNMEETVRTDYQTERGEVAQLETSVGEEASGKSLSGERGQLNKEEVPGKTTKVMPTMTDEDQSPKGELADEAQEAQ